MTPEDDFIAQVREGSAVDVAAYRRGEISDQEFLVRLTATIENCLPLLLVSTDDGPPYDAATRTGMYDHD